MLKLGRAQGVAMAAALYRDIPIFEYSPKTIKQTITGNGNASKEQVAKMLQLMLKFDENPDFSMPPMPSALPSAMPSTRERM